MPYCRNCGTQLADDAHYCYKCGTPTTPTPTIMIHCQNCGTELNSNVNYCYRCGTHTSTNSIPLPSPTTNQPQSTYEKSSNEESLNKNSIPILTIAILIGTIIALIIAIVVFSPFIDIFNTSPFDQPGINMVNFHTITKYPQFYTQIAHRQFSSSNFYP